MIYLLSKEKKEEICKFIDKQLRKRYIRPSKLPYVAPVLFVEKRDGKERVVWNYKYMNKQ